MQDTGRVLSIKKPSWQLALLVGGLGAALGCLFEFLFIGYLNVPIYQHPVWWILISALSGISAAIVAVLERRHRQLVQGGLAILLAVLWIVWMLKTYEYNFQYSQAPFSRSSYRGWPAWVAIAVAPIAAAILTASIFRRIRVAAVAAILSIGLLFLSLTTSLASGMAFSGDDLDLFARLIVRLLLIVGGIALLVASIFLLPRHLISLDTTNDAQGTVDPTARLEAIKSARSAQGAVDPTARLEAINSARSTLLQGLGGIVLIAGAYFTWQQVLVGRQAQVTEQFTQAIEQIGNDESLDVRLGGIYALERIARDSGTDRASIARILSAYVRGHAGKPKTGPATRTKPNMQSAANDQMPSLEARAPDVHAALSALKGEYLQSFADEEIDLSQTDLHGADLRTANLEDVNLSDSDLRQAILIASDLDGANFQRADLQGAKLNGSNLEGADFRAADLRGASLLETEKLDRAILKSAVFDEHTLWPDDFNPSSTGARLMNE